MSLPGSWMQRLRDAGCRFAQDVAIFGAGAVTACAMIGLMRRNEK